LTVTDNSGLTGASSTTITAQQVLATMRVEAISLAVTGTKNKQVRATVRITTPTGAVVSGATVTGQWSGLITGTSTGTTDSTGAVVLTSKTIRKSGLVTFRVSNVTKSDATYDASKNLVT
jgi:hypothetical protein